MSQSSDENSPSASTTEPPPLQLIPVRRILICSTALTLIAGLMLPAQFTSKKEFETDIIITATGMKSNGAKGSEVWVSESPAAGLIESANAPGWERRDRVLVSYLQQPATLHWTGKIPQDYRLEFVRHAFSGQLILTVNGQSKAYDLFSEKDSTPLQIRPFDLMTNPQPVYGWGVLKGIATLLGFFVLIHFTLLFMIRHAGEPVLQERPSIKLYMMLALPSIIIYAIALLAMWPAQMSPDSVTHWAESESGKIEDTHPAILTMALWVVTRIWHSPSVIPFLQILALTSVTVLLLLKLRELGVPRWIYLWVAFAFPLFPANFLMVTTIWKDVPYSIALTFSFYLLLTLTQTKGQAARTRSWQIWFFVAMAVVMLTRHNGILVAVGIPLTCAFCYRKRAIQYFVGSTVGLVALLFLVRTVLYPIFDVRPRPAFYEAANAIHVIAAYRVQGTTFTQAENVLLASVYPLERWNSLYTCQFHGFLLLGDAMGPPNFDALSANMKSLNLVALKLIVANPFVYLRHQACTTSILWRIFPADGDWVSIPPLEIDDSQLAHAYGLASTPKLPLLNMLLKKFGGWSTNAKRSWMFWRPAIWLLLTFIVGVGYSLSRREPRYLLLLTPSIYNTLSMAPLIGYPDYRYQYIAQVIGMFMLPLLFRRSENGVRISIAAATNPLWKITKQPDPFPTKSPPPLETEVEPQGNPT